MKKIALWATVISFAVFVIAWGVLGLEIFSGHYDDMELPLYIGAASWIVLMVSIIALRWSSWKCPHCGKVRWTNGRYCAHCGKEI